MNNAIERLEAERLGRLTVKIEFEVGSETIALVVNKKLVRENLSTWQGCILSALREGHGQTNKDEIIERKEKYNLSPTSNFIRQQVAKLNQKIYKNSGIKNLILGGASVIRLNSEDFELKVGD